MELFFDSDSRNFLMRYHLTSKEIRRYFNKTLAIFCNFTTEWYISIWSININKRRTPPRRFEGTESQALLVGDDFQMQQPLGNKN